VHLAARRADFLDERLQLVGAAPREAHDVGLAREPSGNRRAVASPAPMTSATRLFSIPPGVWLIFAGRPRW